MNKLYRDIIKDCIEEPKMINLYIRLCRNNQYYTKDKQHNKIIIKPNIKLNLIILILSINIYLKNI